MAAGAAWSTQERWTYSQRKFLWFCSLTGVKRAVPTTPTLLMLFCAWLVRCKLSHGTILVHIDGVRVLNANFGHAHPWAETEYVAKRFKAGLLRLTGGERHPKMPLRAQIIGKMVWAMEMSWSSMRFMAVVVVGYHMAIRIGHLVPANKHAVHLLRRRHVQLVWHGKLLVKARVTLPSTKTSRCAIVRWVHRVEGAPRRLSALDWIAWLMQCNKAQGENVPLVTLSFGGSGGGSPWYRAAFNKELKAMLQRMGEKPGDYSGISLRKGCLTDLAVAGRSPLAVAKQATHKSLTSQMSYVEADEELLAGNANELGRLLHAEGAQWSS